MNENDFTQLMDRARPVISADVDRLLAGGVSRGRRSLRLRRAATGLLTAAAVGAVATGLAVIPGSAGQDRRELQVATSEAPSVSEPTEAAGPPPQRPDRTLAVAAVDMPAEVAQLADGDLGPILHDEQHPIIDEPQRRIVHFDWDGTLTTLTIEPAHRRAACEEQAAQANTGNVEGADCAAVDGLDTLIWPANGQATTMAHGVSVWNHGYIVSALSYRAADGKNQDGSEDVNPLMDEPALSIEELIKIAQSDVWFS